MQLSLANRLSQANPVVDAPPSGKLYHFTSQADGSIRTPTH